MRSNTQMLLSRARCQGTFNPAHMHRARCSYLLSHRSPAQRPQDYSFPHSRRLCADKRALCVTPNSRLGVGRELPDGIYTFKKKRPPSALAIWLYDRKMP